MTELDQEMATLSGQLAEHRATAPAAPTENVSLLDHLPVTEIDLNQLAADRLRRFLDAFRVEIHYYHSTRRATLKAQISADMIEQLRQVANWDGRPVVEPHKGDDPDGQTVPAQFWIVPPAGPDKHGNVVPSADIVEIVGRWPLPER